MLPMPKIQISQPIFFDPLSLTGVLVLTTPWLTAGWVLLLWLCGLEIFQNMMYPNYAYETMLGIP